MRTVYRTIFAVTYKESNTEPVTVNVAAATLEDAVRIVRKLEPNWYPAITSVVVLQTVNGNGIYTVEGDF